MRTKDGKIWNASLTIGKVKKIKQRTGINILDLNAIHEIANDLDSYLEVLWVCYEDSNPTLSRDIWENSLDGDCLDQAATDLWDAISFFSPSRKTMMTKIKNAAQSQMDQIQTKMEELTEDQIIQMMRNSHLNDSINSQDKQE